MERQTLETCDDFADLSPASRVEQHHSQPRIRPAARRTVHDDWRSEEHTSELQSLRHLVCRLLLEKKKTTQTNNTRHNPCPQETAYTHPRAETRWTATVCVAPSVSLWKAARWWPFVSFFF